MEIDVIATVVFPGAITHVEAFRGGDVIGEIVLGDILRLASPDGVIELVARRATWIFTTRFETPVMPDPVPAELVPLLQRGATGFRVRIVRAGDQLRIRGAVERHESARETSFVAAGPVRLDEVLRFE